jgi:hypothetical protein
MIDLLLPMLDHVGCVPIQTIEPLLTAHVMFRTVVPCRTIIVPAAELLGTVRVAVTAPDAEPRLSVWWLPSLSVRVAVAPVGVCVCSVHRTMFVIARDVADAAPSVGVTRVGDVAKTSAPDPVSSLITPANCEDVVAANWERFPVVNATESVIP